MGDAEMCALGGRYGEQVLAVVGDFALTGVTMPEIALNNVVLPAPFGPTTATN